MDVASLFVHLECIIKTHYYTGHTEKDREDNDVGGEEVV